MRDVLDPAIGVESFRLCNPPPFLSALNLAALEMFEEVCAVFFYCITPSLPKRYTDLFTMFVN